MQEKIIDDVIHFIPEDEKHLEEVYYTGFIDLMPHCDCKCAPSIEADSDNGFWLITHNKLNS